jgi:hypothetical protein
MVDENFCEDLPFLKNSLIFQSAYINCADNIFEQHLLFLTDLK